MTPSPADGVVREDVDLAFHKPDPQDAPSGLPEAVAAFSQGPWKVVAADGGYIPEDACAFQVQQVRGNGYVLASIITDAPELKTEGAANAALIAAAPALYAALNALVSGEVFGWTPDILEGQHIDITITAGDLMEARAALAKAGSAQ